MKTVQLKEIANITAGYPFRGRISEAAGSSVVVIQMKDVSPNEGIHWPSCLPTKLTGKRDPAYLKIGDILVTARGSHHFATPVDQTLTTMGRQAVAAPHFFVVSITRQDALPEFIAWLLNQTPAQHYFSQNAEGSLTKSIRRSVLEDTPVLIPPLVTQKNIIVTAKTLHEEEQVLKRLIKNGERIMNTMASDLYDNIEGQR